MKKPILLSAILAILAGGVYWYGAEFSGAPEGLTYYMNSVYGISFQYPGTYELTEQEIGNTERSRYSIILIDKESLANVVRNGEGPPVVTFDIFQNNLDRLSLEEWVNGMSFSNYTLSLDGTLAPSSVAGVPALAYTWDGLYASRSVVFEHGENIVMASAGFITEKDQILLDFEEILSTVTLY